MALHNHLTQGPRTDPQGNVGKAKPIPLTLLEQLLQEKTHISPRWGNQEDKLGYRCLQFAELKPSLLFHAEKAQKSSPSLAARKEGRGSVQLPHHPLCLSPSFSQIPRWCEGFWAFNPGVLPLSGPILDFETSIKIFQAYTNYVNPWL